MARASAQKAMDEVAALETSGGKLPELCDDRNVGDVFVSDEEFLRRFINHEGVYENSDEYLQKSIASNSCLKNLCSESTFSTEGTVGSASFKISIECELSPAALAPVV